MYLIASHPCSTVTLSLLVVMPQTSRSHVVPEILMTSSETVLFSTHVWANYGPRAVKLCDPAHLVPLLPALPHYNLHLSVFPPGVFCAWFLLPQPGTELTGPHLQAAPGAVLRHDADVGGVDAGADEPGQVVELDVSHLKNKHSATVRRTQGCSVST